ncbi:hypothetical protein C7271_10360 [filamentous cyanobacterium CCP5]|nr:hypothetical protein C7271_10360 [filamentous cyanobacterium CCP5]
MERSAMTNTPLDFEQVSAPLPADLRTLPIGLSLSGGGYRAAAFHLGTLAYLDRTGLLPQLRRLSTVSGGSFTGAKYIISLIENTEFNRFFQDFYRFLRDENLFKAGLADLSTGKVRVPSGERKLISSLSNVYADTFLKSPEGTPYRLGTILDADIPVQEVVFNATEFRTGVAFRFQKSANRRARIGNGNVYISRESAKQIRLSDVVAASSCFPGGFEPMKFPQDFDWPSSTVLKEVEKDISRGGNPNSVALMDGGIYDNQGIDSLLLADDRKDAEALGLFIISDVDPAQDSLYPYPDNDQPPSALTLGQVDWIIRLFLLLCSLTLIAVGYELWHQINQGDFSFWQDFFPLLMPLVLVFGVLAVLWWGRNLIKTQLLPRIPQVGIAGWQDLKTLKINEFLYILELRFTSLMAMTRSVFMDRIKALIFARVYGDEAYQGKRISNRIDRLANRSAALPGIVPLSPALKTVATRAATMGTTLWFDQLGQLVDVTAAGQATICFNLIQYIVRRYGETPETYPPAIQELWQTMVQDWAQLNQDPYALLKGRLPGEKFPPIS